MSDGRFDEHLQDRLRLLLLLDACEAADLTPIPLIRLHALAFLANVLAPIWLVASTDGKVLKRATGPFYPDLQRQLDRLVGLGMVDVFDVSYVHEDEQWQLRARFALADGSAAAVLDGAREFAAERAVANFLRRLAFATARLRLPVERVVQFDATWSDQRTGMGDVVDFAEWKTANYSARAASLIADFAPAGLSATRGDMLQLYMRLLERKADGA